MLNVNTSITQAGRVVVNCALDKEDLNHRKTADLKTGSAYKRLYDNSSTDDIYMHVVPGEPLFMHKTKTSVGGGRKRRKTVRDTDLVVFSSLNGIIGKKDQSPADFEDDLLFMGFADIQTVFNSDGYTREGCVTQVGGLRTIVNTGGSAIRAGDQIYWSLPTGNHLKSHSKIVAEIHPVRKYTPHMKVTAQSIESRLDKDVDFAATVEKLKTAATPKDKAVFLEGFYQDVQFQQKMRARFRSKIIGVAMKNARPGEELDILIGSYSI